MDPFDQAWALLKMPMVPGSLTRHSTSQDDAGDEMVRYVADFKHPETGEIHPMVADVTLPEVDTIHGRFLHPEIEMNILSPNHPVEDIGDVPDAGIREKYFSQDADYEHSIADAFFGPQQSDDNYGNRNMIGTPRVKEAGPVGNKIRAYRQKVQNDPDFDMSLEEYLNQFRNYKHQGHGTAMYDMAADILDRETRGAHVIVRDDSQTENAQRMWAKHEGRDRWPSRRQR
tara:strand:+ start:5905 stop:6591 length:687 start_codon:yes stop_codon:yes gene_type:complete